MTLEIDTAEVEAVGTETFPAVASLFGNAAALVESAQVDKSPTGLFNSSFRPAWVDYSTQVLLYLKQSEVNLESCGETLATMAREIAAADGDNRDEVEASYSSMIENPDSGSYQEAADLD